ncbi:MAG: hypothetical protein ACREOZ_02630 [Gloeomargaritales cyanobacterium]
MKDDLLELLPPFKDEYIIIVDKQNTDDIMTTLLKAHAKWERQYDLIYPYFLAKTPVEVCERVFDFLKNEVPYTKETEGLQTLKNPTAILTDGETVDCKGYSLFIGGILDAVKRNTNLDYDWCYRFASYDKTQRLPGHVFVVMTLLEGELWIDPVFPELNKGRLHEWELDKTPGTISGLYMLSGPGDDLTGSVTVDPRDAIRNFLVAVGLNLYGSATLIKSHPDILNGPIKQFFAINNYPFDTLLNVLSNVS